MPAAAAKAVQFSWLQYSDNRYLKPQRHLLQVRNSGKNWPPIIVVSTIIYI